MLNTNPETVRRWIRTGKLKADQLSRKDGNTVREDDLYKYLRSTSRYAAIAATLVAANPILSLTTAVSAGVLGAIATSISTINSKKEEDVLILADDLKKTLKKNIAESEGTIARKIAAIADLQEEILKEKQKIKDYEAAIEHLKDALSDIKENMHEGGIN